MDLLYDPIEDDPLLRPLLDAADREAELELANSPRRNHLGFCHFVWQAKKRILREKYHIAWRTPAEMNPLVHFD